VGLHAVPFPHDDAGLLPFLDELRRLFGKRAATIEDDLRRASSRQAGAYRTAAADATDRFEEFLSQVDGTIDVGFGERHLRRALDLLNKTNQFNLNGRRYTQAALQRALRDRDQELVAVAYEDRFGPLGVIAALLIERQADALVVESWAMSCRALARRIEDHTLQQLFTRFDVAAITFEFAETERNAPLREFLETVAGQELVAPVRIEREWFDRHRRRLVHRVRDLRA
jgi:FkbH-like protein